MLLFQNHIKQLIIIKKRGKSEVYQDYFNKLIKLSQFLDIYKNPMPFHAV